MPGVGKTGAAIEFVHRNRANYKRIFWIAADSEESLRSGYDSLAKRLGLVPAHEPDQSAGVNASLRWLSGNSKFLLVLDNADEISACESLIPGSSGKILLTARPTYTQTVAPIIAVGKMSGQEGADCLLAWAGIRNATPEQHADAEIVSNDLGGLPLALRQAGAYIAASNADISGYHSLLMTNRPKLLQWKGKSLDKDARTVHDTFTLAFNKLAKEHAAAAELLRLCAFLAPDSIPETFFTRTPPILPDPLSAVAADTFEWQETLRAAAALALIERNSTNKMFSLHRLVQDVLRAILNETSQKQYVERTVKYLI